MAKFDDDTHRFIASALARSGRVQPDQLTHLAPAERVAALQAFFERFGEQTPLRLTPEALVVGLSPAVDSSPRPIGKPNSEAKPTSEVDQLLGGFDGVNGAVLDPEPGALLPPDSSATGSGLDDVVAGRPARAGSPGASAPRTAKLSVAKRVRQAMTMPPRGQRMWLLWILPTLLLPMLGGIGAWFVLRRKHTIGARVMLGIGLVIALICSLLFLRFAVQIAGFVTGATRDTVISVPSR